MAGTVVIDTTTEFGARVERRLRDESSIWLTTVRADGMPQPSPVGFVWDGAEELIYSEPGKPKLRNTRHSQRVALHVNATEPGMDVVILSGEARNDPDAPPLDALPALVDTCADNRRGGSTPEEMARVFTIPMRVRPVGLKGF